MKTILSIGKVNVNAEDSGGVFPLLNVMLYNRIDILRLLLARDDLDLSLRAIYSGCTALHHAFQLHCLIVDSVPIIRIVCQDRRCTPGIFNMKDYQGETVLLKAVRAGYLDIVMELDKVEGTDFQGDTLIEVARGCGHEAVVEYMIERSKRVDTLRVIAAGVVANMKAETDVENLEIPHCPQRLMVGFLNDKDVDNYNYYVGE